MKFCPVVPEICRGQVHGPRKERRKRKRKRRIRIRIRIIIIIHLSSLCKKVPLLSSSEVYFDSNTTPQQSAESLIIVSTI
jgi:hypothetical protein